MIVDVHTHVFDPKLHFAACLHSDLMRNSILAEKWGDVCARHLPHTQEADLAICFGIQARATGWNVPNEYVAAHVKAAPRRLLLFAAIDPVDPGCLDELRKCHQHLGAVGVKLAPLYSDVHPCDPRCEAVYAYCVQHNMPILFHCGTSFVSRGTLEFSRPIHFDAVALKFPELRMVLAHLGHPWEGECISVIRRHPNVYADLSALYYRPWQFYNSMRLLVEYKSHHKVLFGSDFPFATTVDSLCGIRAINAVLGDSGLPEVPAEVIEAIVTRNALDALGIADPRLE